jgi:hypothetical protein
MTGVLAKALEKALTMALVMALVVATARLWRWVFQCILVSDVATEITYLKSQN